jgi:hypothetical protein
MKLVAFLVLAAAIAHGQAAPSPAAPAPPPNAPAQFGPPLAPPPTRPTGIVLVDSLDQAEGPAYELEEKELYAGYMLIYFKDQTQSAYLAISRDGYTFTDINGGQPVFDGTLLAEQKGVRDPHITRGPDGAFYVVMTDLHIFGQRAGYRSTPWERPIEQYGWGNNRAIVMMKSWDLVHWTSSDFRVDKAFPELGDISTAWAPETVYDEKKHKMMVYFTMRYGPHGGDIYYAYADPTFTKLETKPELLAKVDGADGDITKVGDKFELYYVSDAKVRHGVSDRINGGYVMEAQRIDPEKVATEAPTIFKRLGSDTYVLMYDVYGARPNNMGFSETTDFEHYPWLVAVAFFMESLDTTILNTAVPAISAALHVAPSA